MTSESRNLLVTGGKELGVELSAQQVQALEKLVAELERWNRRINLTAICQEEEVVIKHLLDSLSLVPVLA
ncbi:MAG TPA: RsmG family class I SAM-dependent methyltransferase, partial [Geobacterales bacterium]|nr:RsmG family class I SAM-dependent methyltransferase [Geobacterales bacterium]